MDYNKLQTVLQALENSRLIKNLGGEYELAHDALAGKIMEEYTVEEKAIADAEAIVKRKYNFFIRTNSYLSAKELRHVTPFFANLNLNFQERKFLEDSIKRDQFRRVQYKVLVACAILLLILTLFNYYESKLNKEESIRNKKLLSENKILLEDKDTLIIRKDSVIKESERIATELRLANDTINELNFKLNQKARAAETFLEADSLFSLATALETTEVDGILNIFKIKRRNRNKESSIEESLDNKQASGNNLSISTHFDNAIRKYKEVIRIDSSFLPAYERIGVSLIKNKKFGEAVEHYKTSIEINPVFASRNSFSALVHELNLFDTFSIEINKSKYELLKSAVKVNNKHNSYYSNLGLLIYSNRDSLNPELFLALTEEAFNKIKEPKYDDLLIIGSYHLFNSGGDKADAYFRKIGTRPEELYSHFKIAEILNNNGDYTKALEHIKLILNNSQKIEEDLFSQVLHLAGLIYEDQGNYNEAIEMFSKIPKTYEREHILSHLADAHYYHKDYQIAITYYDSLLQIDPLDEGLLHLKGASLEMSGQFDRAVSVFKFLLKLDSASTDYKDHYFKNIIESNQPVEVFGDLINQYENNQISHIDSTTAGLLYYKYGELLLKNNQNLDEAERSLLISLNSFKKNGKEREDLILKCLDNLAEVFFRLNKLVFASEVNNLAVEYAKKIKVGSEIIERIVERRNKIEKIKKM